MVSLNKSFVYGICFASTTWVISFYLYLKLVSNEQQQQYGWSTSPAPVSARFSAPFSVTKYTYDTFFKAGHSRRKKVTNDEALIRRLQPVVRKPVITEFDDKDISELGMVHTVDEQNKKDEGYKVHAYNVLVSEKLSLHRSIPDTRNALCKNTTYSKDLPKASVVICFYNEHLRTLLRTIHSIIDRTPAEILQEILLVDDYSDLSGLHANLTGYVEKNFDPKVKVLKTERREGLIRARLFGSRRSKGDALVFLDSHIEVNRGWLEPLLQRIKDGRTNVVMPVIDIVNADTFAYTSSPLVRGGFNWGLHFKWENLPKGTLSKNEDFIKPIKSPTMAGGLFAMDRKYFVELGEYDAGMNIWGGENLEISFRIWMCGGQLELIPCSRVGHVFRQRRPYGSPDGEDTMLHNSLRVAHVWMDDHKKYFLEQRRDAKRIDYGDISSRLQLRKELKCHDFDWYLKNVYPELTWPTDTDDRLKKKWAALERDKFQPWHSRKRNYVRSYQIRLANTSLCLQSTKDLKSKGSTLSLRSCIRASHQIWYETDRKEMVLGKLLCLQADKPGPILYKCHEMGGDQEWRHKGEKGSPIYNVAAGTCLGVKKKEVNSVATMKLCSDPTLAVWDIVT